LPECKNKLYFSFYNKKILSSLDKNGEIVSKIKICKKKFSALKNKTDDHYVKNCLTSI
jgi:hypothetical protein